jgi:hypothetical protein
MFLKASSPFVSHNVGAFKISQACYLNHDVSETGFCLRLVVEHTHFGAIYGTSLCLRRLVYVLGTTEYVPPEDGDTIQSPKLCVLNKEQEMANVQNCDS